MLTEVGRHSLALMKTLTDDMDFEALSQMAEAVENSFLMETGQPVYIGVSEPRDDLSLISEAFEEARSAHQHWPRLQFLCHHLLLQPPAAGALFVRPAGPMPAPATAARIFNRQTAKLFNDEMLHTIETFFENSLNNLSETARKLYIHRNTLVYRLEKGAAGHRAGLALVRRRSDVQDDDAAGQEHPAAQEQALTYPCARPHTLAGKIAGDLQTRSPAICCPGHGKCRGTAYTPRLPGVANAGGTARTHLGGASAVCSPGAKWANCPRRYWRMPKCPWRQWPAHQAHRSYAG